MSRAEEVAGFKQLLCVDVPSGRVSGALSILVPFSLAEAVNHARRNLLERRDRADAWASACVPRIAPKVEPENDDDDDAKATPLPAPAPPPPSPPPPAPPAPMPAASRPARKKHACRGGGRLVPIIDIDMLAQRSKAAAHRLRFSSEEKKTEVKVLDELIARGALRKVALPSRWPALLAELREAMPNFADVVKRIEAACALAQATRKPLRVPPILLAGPPGVGKTHFALRLATLLGVPRFVHALESAETVSTLNGADKHWSQSEPGQLWQMIVVGETANPVVLLDELDKASRGTHYRPANALHAVLESGTARALRDKSMDVSFDASYVIYLATCNRLSQVDATLLSRFEIFFVDEPEPREAVAIARSIVRQVIGELNLGRRFEVPAGEIVQQLAMLGGPRRMHKVLHAAFGRALLAGRNRLVLGDLLDSGQQEGDGHGALH